MCHLKFPPQIELFKLIYRWQKGSFTPSLNPTSSTVGFDNECKIIFTGDFKFRFQCTNDLPFPPILLLPLLLLDFTAAFSR